MQFICPYSKKKKIKIKIKTQAQPICIYIKTTEIMYLCLLREDAKLATCIGFGVPIPMPILRVNCHCNLCKDKLDTVHSKNWPAQEKGNPYSSFYQMKMSTSIWSQVHKVYAMREPSYSGLFNLEILSSGFNHY